MIIILLTSDKPRTTDMKVENDIWVENHVEDILMEKVPDDSMIYFFRHWFENNNIKNEIKEKFMS